MLELSAGTESYATYKTSRESDKEIMVRIATNSVGRERSASPDVSAFYNRQSNTVSVTLYETGAVTIYVVDSRGQVVVTDYSEDGVYDTATLYLPSLKGIYTLVIWSDCVYGEGTFTVE